MMKYRRLGRSNLQVSVVGIGTCQMRLISQQQAIDTLKRGFELGVNLVHTSPDYEGTDSLVAQAIEESPRQVTVLTQGYGPMDHFEWLFETACLKFNKKRLDTFGIACIDDREHLDENVWGKGGMIEFLMKKKLDGRLGSIFCTTHGPPDYVAHLITSGLFDAIMLSYNMLGFHLLSYNPGENKSFENIPLNRDKIFPLAAQHDVGLMIMKPLAGGLLCQSKAFPSHKRFSTETPALMAYDILSAILMHPEISCVVPGTASPEEAEENARAGSDQIEIPPKTITRIKHSVDKIKLEMCNRCGQCDSLCSKNLPISWLFRDAYISNYPAETFETIDDLQYFHLHPDDTAACSTCEVVSCSCPSGIDIPTSLIDIHNQMLNLRKKGLLPIQTGRRDESGPKKRLHAELLRKEIPDVLLPGASATCRLYLQNESDQVWRFCHNCKDKKEVFLTVTTNGSLLQKVALRHDVEPGARTHFSFDIIAPTKQGTYKLLFQLVQSSRTPFFLSVKNKIDILTVLLTVQTGG